MTVDKQMRKVPRRVDQSSIKVSQSATIVVMVLAFTLNSKILVAVVGMINLVGAVSPSFSLWKLLYHTLLKPTGLVNPQVIPDNPEPHRFAQGVGGGLAVMSAVFLFMSYDTVGWVLGWLLVFLASLNVFAGFCMGCFIYYQMNRLGFPGFYHSKITNTEGKD